MSGGSGGPKAEPIVVLGRKDNHLEAGRLEFAHPLLGIQLRRFKEGGRFLTVAPLSVGKGIDAKVEESRQFHPLPLQLLRGGHKAGGHIYLLFYADACRKFQMLHEISVLALSLHGQGYANEEEENMLSHIGGEWGMNLR